MEARSAYRRGSIIDRSNCHISGNKPSSTRYSSPRTDSYAAIIDAERVCVVPRLSTRILALIYIKAIETHPCIIAYIAKSLALVGKGDKDDGYRTCDIAFAPFQSSHASFLLLIKVGVLQSRVSCLLILLRPLSSFWPESTVTRYCEQMT